MLINYGLIALTGFTLSLILINFLRNLSLRRKLLTSGNVPLIGGLVIAASFLLVVVFILLEGKILPREIIGIIVSSIIMLIFGLLDDWKELSVAAKFSAQIVACSVLILLGVHTRIIHIGGPLNIVITFIWIIGITNAFNLLDVSDAVAPATALVVSAAFLAIALLKGDAGSAILLLSLIGPICGVLIYNMPPAKIYLGNSGSHFLGFALASLAIVLRYAPIGREIALFSPVLILGFPIFDTTFLILTRIGKKRIPFNKSNDHLVLRLSSMGYSKKKAMLIMVYWNTMFALCGILLVTVSNFLGTSVIAIAILACLSLAKKMSSVGVDG